MAIDETVRRDRRTVLALGGIAVAGLAVLRFRDPHAGGAYGLCPFHELTGQWCPLCGGLRATYDLTRLRLGDAMSSNVLAVAIVLGVLGYFSYWAAMRWRGQSARTFRLGSKGLLTVAIVAVAFTVVRNVPLGSALAP